MFRELTRINKALPMEECAEVLRTQTRGVLSVNGDDGYPYGMPMNHWYDEATGKIWFHCGRFGHRLDALRRDNRVSFCTHDEGCRREGEWALNVRSVIVFGTVRVVDDLPTITRVTTALSHKFTSDDEYIRAEIARFAPATLLLELTPQHICGKLVEES